jgi:hypothetical protein
MLSFCRKIKKNERNRKSKRISGIFFILFVFLFIFFLSLPSPKLPPDETYSGSGSRSQEDDQARTGRLTGRSRNTIGRNFDGLIPSRLIFSGGHRILTLRDDTGGVNRGGSARQSAV